MLRIQYEVVIQHRTTAKTPGVVAYLCHPNTGEAEKAAFWGSVASQPDHICKTKTSERPVLKKKKMNKNLKIAKGLARLTSDMYNHIYENTHTHI